MLYQVTNIFCYSNFKELYKHHNKLSIGYKEDEVANYSDMYNYYPKDKMDKHGVLGIQIEVIF